MIRYRIVSEGLYHYVEAGKVLTCYWVGSEPPMQWTRCSRFYTYLEAQQYVAFMLSQSPSSFSDSYHRW